jgi:hypothetical protein
MATKYAVQQVGVADGTAVPATKADGREVGGTKRVIVASKIVGEAWNDGDVIYLGKKPAGEKITGIHLVTGTSLGTSTVSIGTEAAPAKYASAATVTTTNIPVAIGPLPATLDDPAPGEEALWATIDVANIGTSVVATILIETTGV